MKRSARKGCKVFDVHIMNDENTSKEHKLYAKFSKCEFFKAHIQYLGHVISKDGISVDIDKIKAVINWPIPKGDP